MSNQTEYREICQLTLDQFIEKSKYLKVKVIGTIKTLFKHNKYIIEIYSQRRLAIRSFKRYNQFQALHQLILMKYKNYQLQQMPSKFQIFNKQESRRQHFQNMLQKIIKDHQHINPNVQRLEQTKRRMLSIIYLFLTSENQEQKQQKRKTRKISQDNGNSISSQNSENKGQKKQEKALIERHKQDNPLIDNISKKLEQIANSAPQKINRTLSALPQGIKNYKFDQKFFKQAKTQRKHRFSADLQNSLDTSVDILQKNRQRSNSVERQYQNTVNKQVVSHENQFDVKFQNEDQWKRRYLYIRESKLQLLKNKLDNNFKTKIELFQITAEFWKRNPNLVDHICEKMEFNVKRTFNKNPQVLTLYHQHDYQKIMIKKPLKQGQDPAYNRKILQQLKQKLLNASKQSPIEPNYDGVFNPIGKVFICLHKIRLKWKKNSENQTIQIRIKTGALSYQARPIVYGKEVQLKQGFLIPISNSFQIIKFQCITIKDQGFVKDNTYGKVMGTFSFTMTELLTKPSGHLIDRLILKLETQESRAQKYETTLQVSIQNFSDISSIYSESYANQHDGKPLKPLSGLDDVGQLTLTVDRILRIMGNIALFIQAFWRNVYLFKYPRMGYCFFALILINALFFQIHDIMRQFHIFLVIVIAYQQKYVNIFLKYLMDKYIFAHIHLNFKKPLILSTSQVKYLKWSKQLQYIAQDYLMIDGKLQKKSDKSRTLFEFQVHGNKFYVKQEQQTFFQKFKQAKKVIELIHKMIDTVANTIEKIGNLLTWYDSLRTFAFIMLILIFSGVASGIFIRSIVTVFCIHRFYKGTYFYRRKHYRNNRKFAVYCLNYILTKNFPNLIKTNGQMSYEELEEVVNHVVFPIHEEVNAKKLKSQMDDIMGVYLDYQSLGRWAIKKNYLKIGVLVDIVETCQSRLKLKWVSGPEGISNQFQELRSQTKQIPVIDIWVQHLVVNFIMNIPSQLYTTFWNSDLTNMRKIKQIHRKQTKNILQGTPNKGETNSESFASSNSQQSIKTKKQ